MALVTFTSDLGTRDYYTAAIKGAIYSHCEKVVPIVDVTHQVKTFDIKEAAYIVRNCYKYFPKGTIHLIHVGAQPGKTNVCNIVLAVFEGQYFITFDSGLLSLVFEKMPHETYLLNDELLADNSHLYESAIGKAVNLLVNDYRPSDFAQLTTEIIQYRPILPLTAPGRVQGSVVHVDEYGNAITNITHADFQQHIADKKFIMYTGVEQVDKICAHYADVDVGDVAAFFNASGLLEIAINKARADHLLALKVGSSIQINAF